MSSMLVTFALGGLKNLAQRNDVCGFLFRHEVRPTMEFEGIWVALHVSPLWKLKFFLMQPFNDASHLHLLKHQDISLPNTAVN